MATSPLGPEHRRSSGHVYHSQTVSGGHVQFGDRYFILNGEDFGGHSTTFSLFLALSIFPVVVDTLTSYSHTFGSRSATDLASKLRTCEAIFKVQLETLLSSIASEEELDLARTGKVKDLWQRREFSEKLIENLGQDEIQPLLEAAENIYKTLTKLKNKLPELETTDKADATFLARAKKVIKCFFYGDSEKPSFGRLETNIKRFSDLLHTTQNSISVKPRARADLQDLQEVQEAAEGLYNAFKNGWRCGCDHLHPANIGLDRWWTNRNDAESCQLLKFSFLFAEDAEKAQVHHWMTAELKRKQTEAARGEARSDGGIGISASPTSLNSNDSAGHSGEDGSQDSEELDLCEVISTRSSGSGSSPVRRRLGSLSCPNDDRDFELCTDFAFHALPLTHHSVKLSEALQSVNMQDGEPRSEKVNLTKLHPRRRIRIALLLALGVLQISHTGWLKGYWTRDNILLVVDSSEEPRPYIIHRFESSRRNSNSSSSSLSPAQCNSSSIFVESDTLFALAVFLIEMCYGKRIEDLAARTDKDSNGEISGNTSFLTACRLAKQIEDEMGRHYAQAVKGCLHWSAHSLSNDSNATKADNFNHHLLQKIVQPLEELSKVF